jgi:outer membrane receptor for ferrienterochelin and colicin
MSESVFQQFVPDLSTLALPHFAVDDGVRSPKEESVRPSISHLVARPLRNRTSRSVAFAVALVIGLLFAGPAFAQGIPTATLSGRVLNDALGLPGVTVTAKSPSLQGIRTTATGANGDYVFANVPPGDYTITFTLQGFQTVTKTITLSASQTSRLDTNIAVSAVLSEVTVSGQAESVSQSTMAATTYTSSLLAELPTARTITSAVLLSPGVVAGVNGPQISGAASIENLYTVNGVVIVDNVRTSPNNLFIEDAVQETTTMTSAVSAEYGRFSGGVVNTITKSGGNAFSGSFRSTLSNDAWRSTSAYRTAAGVNPQEGTFLQKVLPSYEATLGGPLYKDTLWFFGAGRYQDRTSSSLTTYTNIAYVPQTTEKRYEGKLTFSPFQSHTITGSYIGIDTKQNNYTQFTTFDLDSLSNRQMPQSLLAVNYNGVLSDSFFVEGQYSRRKFSFENSGSPYSDPLLGTPVVDQILGPQMNSAYYCGHCSAKERNNDNYLVKGTYFLSTAALGSHNVVAGYDDFGGQRHEDNYQSGSNWIIYTSAASIIRDGKAYPVIDPNGEVDFWPIFGSGTSDIRTRSFYVNDTWRLNNKLSMNIGLRYDRNHAVDPLGVVTSNDSAFSPRLDRKSVV